MTDIMNARRSCDDLAEADLARSGLTLKDAQDQGWYAVDDASTVDPGFRKEPALVIPYRDLSGRPVTYTKDGKPHPYVRVRYLGSPKKGLLPPGNKYAQPKGSGVEVFVPTGLWEELQEGKHSAIVIVEGEKKALACWNNNIPAIGLGGVDSFRASDTKSLHPSIKNCLEKVKRVHIVFDSDIMEKEGVAAAEKRLASDLALAGAVVCRVRLPGGKDGSKVGVDDFIVENGAKALHTLLNNTKPMGSGGLNPISFADLLTRDVKPVEELIPGLVQKGIVTFLCGPGGTHKSRLALQWALCLNAGRDQWGSPWAVSEAEAGSITAVYVAAEDDSDELARRCQAIQRRLKLPKPVRGLVLARAGQDSTLCTVEESGKTTLTLFYHELMDMLRSIPGHKLVVLDSAYDFARFNGRAKVSEDAVNHYIKVTLAGICSQADATLLIPWHPSQAGSSRGEMDGWSVAWHNAPRARLAISEAKDVRDCYTLEVVKRNHAAKGPPVTLIYHEGALVPAQTITSGVPIRDIVVCLAKQAAELGAPITKRRNIPDGFQEALRTQAGPGVSGKDIKKHLALAEQAGELVYIEGRSKQAAGYYPKESAESLARSARQPTQPTGAQPGGVPSP